MRRTVRSIPHKAHPFIRDPLEKPIERPALKTRRTIEETNWLLPCNDRASAVDCSSNSAFIAYLPVQLLSRKKKGKRRANTMKTLVTKRRKREVTEDGVASALDKGR